MEKKHTGRLAFRIVTSILALILLILFIAPLAVNNIRDLGNLFGIVFCAVYLIWINNLLWVGRLKKKIKEHKVSKMILNIIYTLVIIGVVYAIAVSASMVTAIVKTPEPGSTVVVLGCKVNGESPSLMLRKRLEAAYSYLDQHKDAVCIVSGGQGPNEGISEAQCMYNYLTEHGIDKTRIYMEDKSTDTDENIRFSQKIIEQNQLSPALAVATDGFHELRASIIAQKNGVESVGSVPADTPLYLLPTYWVREWFAIPVEIIK